MNRLKKQKMKMILIVFAGSMMVAHGLRMMIQGVLYPTSFYPAPLPTTLDFWFDWFFLSVIGIIIFLWGLFEFFQTKKGNDKTFDPDCIIPT